MATRPFEVPSTEDQPPPDIKAFGPHAVEITGNQITKSGPLGRNEFKGRVGREEKIKIPEGADYIARLAGWIPERSGERFYLKVAAEFFRTVPMNRREEAAQKLLGKLQESWRENHKKIDQLDNPQTSFKEMLKEIRDEMGLPQPELLN